jgi:hypothetical protein
MSIDIHLISDVGERVSEKKLEKEVEPPIRTQTTTSKKSKRNTNLPGNVREENKGELDLHWSVGEQGFITAHH